MKTNLFPKSLLVLGCLALLWVALIPARAQYQPNDNISAAPAPSTVIANQLRLGIVTGTSFTAADGTVTNTFPTNTVFTVLPTVQVTQYGATLTTTDLVTSITLSNFVYKAGAPNVTNSWVAIGH